MIKGPFYFDLGSEPSINNKQVLSIPPSSLVDVDVDVDKAAILAVSLVHMNYIRGLVQKARFKARQSEEREQRLAEMLENGASTNSRTSPAASATSTNSMASSISEISSLEESLRVGGRVRQMFEERRKNGGGPLPVPTGWDAVDAPHNNPTAAAAAVARGRSQPRRPHQSRNNAGGGGGGGKPPTGPITGLHRPTPNVTTQMRRSKSVHRLENGGVAATTSASAMSTSTSSSSSSPPSLNPSRSRVHAAAAISRSSSQPPRFALFFIL
ncbi:unnamed protein product [Notodromas monacha]|uniref:Uncharacterized protein n=1 Tax=Notodromas monacha TaxID=399045 RepID=A0A7R9GIW6_9CRUS|nr:unnamed protein product [Notodromas monacha]CAG0924253.1 unnamed protein product [Notodromas monacha]